MNLLIRALDVLLASMFVAFAYLQLNDQQGAVGWTVSYLALGMVAASAAAGKATKLAAGIGVTACAAGIAFALPGLVEFILAGQNLRQAMSPEHPYVEQARECGGLAIGLMAMLFVYWQAIRRTAGRSSADIE